MNERIKKLAEQASKEAFPIGSMAWMEKFAMLVIQDYENDVRESRREVKSQLGYSRIGRNNV